MNDIKYRISLRQRAIDALLAVTMCQRPSYPCRECVQDAERNVDALIAAGLIADSPVHQLAARADANDQSVSLMRAGGDERPWIVEEHAQRDAAWSKDIDAAAQYALDQIAQEATDA